MVPQTYGSYISLRHVYNVNIETWVPSIAGFGMKYLKIESSSSFKKGIQMSQTKLTNKIKQSSLLISHTFVSDMCEIKLVDKNHLFSCK